MHLIPHSWAHLHILVSVFPSVGLVFVLGFYVAAFRTENETLKRTCLLVFGILGLLAIPTYYSGDGSQEALAADPRGQSGHGSPRTTAGALPSLGMLAATGLAAFIDLRTVSRQAPLRQRGASGARPCPHHARPDGVVGELGWEINHHELFIDPAEAEDPELWSHVHIILNHFPTVGFVFALGFYITALVLNNEVMKRGGLALFVICAIVIVPTFVTGNASMRAVTDRRSRGFQRR